MTDEGTVTVELGVREARALVNAANMMGEVLAGVLDEDPGLRASLGLSPGVRPLTSAAMKLEMAIVLVGAEP